MILPPKEILAQRPKPNFLDPVTRGPGIVIANAITIAAAIFVVSLRLYTRFWVVKQWGADDVLILVATILAIALSWIVMLADFSYGWERHAWDLPLTSITPGLKLGIAFMALFETASTVTKLSLLYFYQRVLIPSATSRMHKANIALLIFVILQGVIFLFTLIFQCNPVEAYWTINPTYPFSCMDENLLLTAESSINTFTDFLVVLFPIPIVYELQMHRQQRMAIMGLFLLALSVCVVGIVRTVMIRQVMGRSLDLTWDAWPLWIVSALEINVGVVAVSLPALRPLVRRIWPHLVQSISRHRSSHVQIEDHELPQRTPKDTWTGNFSTANNDTRITS